jgi:DNA-binding LacI/PurR family transcriptional regulator
VLYGPVSTLYSIEQAASSVGMGVSIAVVERISYEAVERALVRLQDQSVEGVVALAAQLDAVDVLTAKLRPVPTVFVGGLLGGGAGGEMPTVPAIGIDQRGGAARATRHLLELGHRTVHHVAGPADWLDARWRVEGWHSALTEAGAPVTTPEAGDWGARSGFAAMQRLLAADPDLTAVFAANDHMALGALRALDEAGRRVPEDVSLVGFDDVPEAEFFGPPLTTVRQHFPEAGRRAVRLLLEIIRPDEAAAFTPHHGSDLVPTDLVLRRSTGPAR